MIRVLVEKQRRYGRSEGRREGVVGWGREGANEQGRNTGDVRRCLVWSNQATGYNSSQ